MGLRIAYDSRSDAREKRREEAATAARIARGGRGDFASDPAPRHASLNFLAPQNFRKYPLEKDKYEIKQPIVHLECKEGYSECYEISSAALKDPDTNETENFYIRPEDIHFHNLYIDRCAVEFLFFMAKRAERKLMPREEVSNDVNGYGAGGFGNGGGYGRNIKHRDGGAEIIGNDFSYVSRRSDFFIFTTNILSVLFSLSSDISSPITLL